MTSIDSGFGLRKNPFSTQGSDTSKTDFVPTKAFKELTDKIDKVRHEKNSRAIIVQGPQGSGKTATKKGLDQQYSAQSDVGIIQVTLSSLDLRDLTWSIVFNAKEQNLIDDTFLTEVGYEEGKDLEKPKLEKIIVNVLKKAVSKKEFGILIIDEFDIIAQPAFHDTNDQTIFLHNITNILNAINDEIENPMATILAQTSKSAEEFRDYIDLRHRPLASRLQDPVDMSYDLDETKKITKIKLQAEAIDVFAEKRKGNELFPLDDETLEYLFEHVNALTQTANKMTAYRDVEQILHDAIEESLEQNKEKVELSIVQEIFEKRKSKIGNPSENKRKLSLETRNAIDSAMKNQDQNDANCDYLNGIKVGMAEFEPREYSKVESAMASSWKTDSSTGIFISSIKIKITTATEGHLEKNILWYNVSKTGNLGFTDEEFTKIQAWLEENKQEQIGCQRVLLTIFTDTFGKSEADLQSQIINSVDKIFYRSILFKKAIVGLFLAESDEEREQFREEWDQQLHPICANYLGATLSDVGGKIDHQKHVALIEYLYLRSLAGKKLTKSDWLKWAKLISGAKITSADVGKIKNFGFTDDECRAIVPRNLKSLKSLIDSNKNEELTDDEIKKYFGNDFTINAARLLETITEKNELIDLTLLKQSISDEVIDRINTLLSGASSTTEYLELLGLFKDAFDKIDEEHDYFKKVIVLNCIKKYASKLCSDLESGQIVPTPEPGIPEPGIPEPGIPEPGIPEPGIPEPPEPGEELTEDKIKEVCKDILSNQKLKLSDLKNEIRKKSGFEDESKWVSKLLELIRSGTILLTIDD